MRIDLDMPVSCVDGAFGDLMDVVIAPGSRRLTHIVVAPHDRPDRAVLVATQSARAGDGVRRTSDTLVLDCTVAAISRSDPIHESAYLRIGETIDPGPDWGVGIQDDYPLAESSTLGPELLGSGMAMEYDTHVGINFHRIPKGEVEIRRASGVTSADGHHVGHVVGFVIDDDDQITEFILEHGHLWGKRMVPVKAAAIDRFENDELLLTLSGDEVGALEPLPSHHHWGL
jgi:sporulation protein YlmC with PRC-barrel domain